MIVLEYDIQEIDHIMIYIIKKQYIYIHHLQSDIILVITTTITKYTNNNSNNNNKNEISTCFDYRANCSNKFNIVNVLGFTYILLLIFSLVYHLL
jgi:hypothetical protein